MKFIPYMERASHAAGLEEGLQQGLQEGILGMAIRQARKRFPQFQTEDETALRALRRPTLEAFTEALLDFASIDDLRRWLAETPNES